MALTKDEVLLLERLVDEKECRKARNDIKTFAKRVVSGFNLTPFHAIYYDVLQMFADGRIKNLIITIPPQHGKSLGSSDVLPAYIFGQQPSKKMALVSYNATTASKFNRSLQRRIDAHDYNRVFPNTKIGQSRILNDTKGYLRNTEEFEIVEHGGFFRTVGVGGALTSYTVDVLIMDDLYKDYQDATSPAVSSRVWDWYLTVAKTRLHNESQQLIVFTRWDENDLIGRLEKERKVVELNYNKPIEETARRLKADEFLKINFPALKVGPPTLLDQRKEGEALWPKKHSKAKLIALRDLDLDKFNALNQGNPVNTKSLMYGQFEEWERVPPLKMVKAYCDSADTGKDYLCCIIYGLPIDSMDKRIYVLDIVYTQDAMEVTEPLVAKALTEYEVNIARIESNNGGRSFARTLDRLTPINVVIQWFHQSKNKQARILSHSAAVSRTLVMPRNWKNRYTSFADHVSTYKKNSNNPYDDGPDAMTGVIESESTNITGTRTAVLGRVL